jgi:hypothetical protein
MSTFSDLVAAVLPAGHEDVATLKDLVLFIDRMENDEEGIAFLLQCVNHLLSFASVLRCDPILGSGTIPQLAVAALVTGLRASNRLIEFNVPDEIYSHSVESFILVLHRELGPVPCPHVYQQGRRLGYMCGSTCLADSGPAAWRCKAHSEQARQGSTFDSLITYASAFPDQPEYVSGSAINLDEGARDPNRDQVGCALCARHMSLEAVLIASDEIAQLGLSAAGAITKSVTFTPEFLETGDKTAIEAAVTGDAPVFCQCCAVTQPGMVFLISAMTQLAKSADDHLVEDLSLEVPVSISDVWIFRTPSCYISERAGLRERSFQVMETLGLPRAIDYQAVQRPSLSPQGAALLRERELRNARTREEHMQNLQFNINDATRTPSFPFRTPPHAPPMAGADVAYEVHGAQAPAPAPVQAPAPARIAAPPATFAPMPNFQLQPQFGQLLGGQPPPAAPTPAFDFAAHAEMMQNQLTQLTQVVGQLASTVAAQQQQQAASPASTGTMPVPSPVPAPAPGGSPASSVSNPSAALHLLPNPPHAFISADVTADPYGFPITSREHFLHPDTHLFVDYLANYAQTARSPTIKTAYGAFVSSHVGHHRIDVAPAHQSNRFTPLGNKFFTPNNELVLGDGLQLRAMDKEASVPVQSQWVRYAQAVVQTFYDRLNRPVGEFTLASAWGAYRRWQAQYVITVFQLLNALDHIVMVETSDALTWHQAWMLKCQLVARYFYNRPLVLHGPTLTLLRAVQDSVPLQLNTLGSPHQLVYEAAYEMVNDTAIRLAVATSQEVLVSAAKPAKSHGDGGGGGAAAAAAAAAAHAAAGGGGAQPPPSPTRIINLCGKGGCSYQHPNYVCTHVFVVPCQGKTAKGACGIAHARTGLRKWTCKEARAAGQVLSAAEQQTAFQTSYVDFCKADATRGAAITAAIV